MLKGSNGRALANGYAHADREEGEDSEEEENEDEDGDEDESDSDEFDYHQFLDSLVEKDSYGRGDTASHADTDDDEEFFPGQDGSTPDAKAPVPSDYRITRRELDSLNEEEAAHRLSERMKQFVAIRSEGVEAADAKCDERWQAVRRKINDATKSMLQNPALASLVNKPFKLMPIQISRANKIISNLVQIAAQCFMVSHSIAGRRQKKGKQRTSAIDAKGTMDSCLRSLRRLRVGAESAKKVSDAALKRVFEAQRAAERDIKAIAEDRAEGSSTNTSHAEGA